MDLSVVIVNYKVRDLLAQTIRSLRSAEGYDQCEVIVVDNDSRDGSEELIAHEFPEVIWIGLKINAGFGKACNIGAEQAHGTYLLMLNPDTIVSTDTLVKAVSFMKSRPDVGILGPKVLNQDGTFYRQCHRGLPTPFNAFGHFTKLSTLFPKNRQLSSYFMSWLSIDEEHEIEAVSGSCFFIPTDLYREIGGFDESFFMYGEDLDICVQVRLRGKKVWYAPITKIIHFQGKSSAQRKFRSRLAFYNAMIIYSRKYAKSNSSFFPSKLIETAVLLQAFVSFCMSAVRHLPAFLIDAVLINTLIPLITIMRFHHIGKPHPYESYDFALLTTVHVIATLSLAGPFFAAGFLRNRDGYLKPALFSIGIFLSLLFLAHPLAFSRFAFLICGFSLPLLMIGWRTALPKVSKLYSSLVRRKPRTLLITEEPLLSTLLTKLDGNSHEIIGIISQSGHGELSGYPVFGTIESLSEIAASCRPDQLIIASSCDWYSILIDTLSQGLLKNVTIQWLPQNNPHGELKEFSV